MNINPRIINVKDMDEEKHAYAICECTSFDEVIEIDKDDEVVHVFNCPRCGKKLGLRTSFAQKT